MRIGMRVSVSVSDGASIRSMMISFWLRLAELMNTVSISTLFCLAMRACSSALPRFSLPSEMRTMRLPVPSGKQASASFRAEPMSV